MSKDHLLSQNSLLVLGAIFYQKQKFSSNKEHLFNIKALYPLQEKILGKLQALPQEAIDTELKHLVELGLVVESNGLYSPEALGKAIAYTYIERENHVQEDYWDLLRMFFDDCSKKRILDIGSAGGVLLSGLDKMSNDKEFTYIGLDISLPMLMSGTYFMSSKDIRQLFICGSCERIPMAPSSVDYLFARSIILYVCPTLFFSEAYRVLKPGGKLMVITPTYRFDLYMMLRSKFKTKIHALLSFLNGLQMFLTKKPVLIRKLSSYSIFPRQLITICKKNLFEDIRIDYFKNPAQVTKHLVLTACKKK